MIAIYHFARRLSCLLLLAVTVQHLPTMAQDQVAVEVGVEELVELDAEQVFDDFADMDVNGHAISDLLFQRLRVTQGIIVRATKLDDKQLEELKKHDEAWLKKFIQEHEKKNRGQKQNGAGGLLGFLGVGQQQAQIIRNQNPAAAAKRYEEDATSEMMKILTEDQREEVNVEIRRQNEFRAKAQAKQIIGLLTSRISLSPEEREALLPRLIEWSKTNELYMQIYASNANMIPQLPAKMLRETLSQDSRALYKSFQTYNYSPENVWGMHRGDEAVEFEELP